ncbi:MAG: hypothetical protein MUC42_00490 [Bryobacter sp.]|nr:hypothetical protein [Bryobacter sp.]
MIQRFAFSLAALLSAAALAPAIEIATGRMLGTKYDQRSFYIRETGGKWRKTYTGREFRPQAAGRLMNLRIAQALFHDEWLTEFPFDAEKNTDAVIAALDTYKKHGVLAVNISLQCGNPGYNREFAGIKRSTAAKAGPGQGMLCSAFLPDGSLKKPWQDRLHRFIRAADQRGMIVDLMYFYQSQDEVLKDAAAIRNAVRNATDFLIDNNLRNVIIEIANETDIRGWDHELYIERDMGALMEIARARFKEKRALFLLPICTSSGPSMKLFDSTVVHGDLTVIHGNNKTPAAKGSRTKELAGDRLAPGPILMNEDDNGRATSEENLKKELASCDAVWDGGGSWGYMPWRQTQLFPFQYYNPAGDSQDEKYFRAVLEHIRAKVFR